MSLRRLGLLTCLILALCSALGDAAHTSRYAATSGALDLSGYDSEIGVIPLHGEWEFYWERLLTPDDFRSDAHPAPDGHIGVPGSWNGHVVDGETLTGRGYATYRLLLRLPPWSVTGEETARLALHIPWTFTAYTLWINGTLAAKNGAVGSTPEAMRPEFRPITVPFSPKQETVELILQVSNFHHRNGGVWNSPLFGTYDQLAHRQALREAIDTFLIGAILFMAIYHLSLFLWFRERPASIYLGFTCLVIGVRTMVTSEHLLDQLLLGLPWTFELKVEYVTGYAFLIGFIGFLRSIFPEETPKVAEVSAWVVAGFGIVTSVFFPVSFSSLFIPHYILVLGLFMLFGAGVLVIAALQTREGATLTVWGGIALVFALFHDFFHYNLMGLDMDVLPLGLFVLLLFQSLALGERIAIGFRRELALAEENGELLQTVRAQLDEVRQSRRMVAAADEELRKNIAERLHGRVQTRLLAIWHRMGMLKEALPQGTAAVGGTIEDLRRDIDEIREVEIRQVSHLLHPSIVRVGLIPAVDSLVREFRGSFAVRVHVDDQVKAWDDPARNAISESVRLVTYRALEDALGNVQAHAQARTVTIRILAVADGRLRIEVADDGRGFNRASLEPRLGLHAIAARVSTVGGSWEIDSHLGAGTILTVELPITPDAADDGSPVRDPVTRLLARGSLESVVGAVLEQAKRTQTHAGMVYVAVCGIQTAYKQRGPEAVDGALRAIADTVRQRLGPSGIAFRYHEDALVALLPEVEADTVHMTAGAIRSDLSGRREQIPVPFEVKVGAAIYPTDAVHAHGLIERAASDAFKQRNTQ